MYEWFLSWPLWLRVIITVWVLSMLLGDALKNIYEKKYCSWTASELILFIIIVTGVINSLISVDFKLW